MTATVPTKAAQTAHRFTRIETILLDRKVVTVEQLSAAKDRQRGAKLPLGRCKFE